MSTIVIHTHDNAERYFDTGHGVVKDLLPTVQQLYDALGKVTDKSAKCCVSEIEGVSLIAIDSGIVIPLISDDFDLDVWLEDGE